MNVKNRKKVDTPKKEPMTKEQAEKLAEKLRGEGVGRYVIGLGTKGNTKLLLKDLKKDTKEEMFSLFCVTWDKIKESGLCLARIDGFRVDKNNNVYMIAKHVLSLADVDGVFAKSVWDFALPYSIMWQPYGDKRDTNKRCNVEAAYEQLGYEKGEDEGATRAKMWADMVDGKFSFEDLAKALNTKTSYEMAAGKMYKDWKSGKLELLTYLVDRLEREDMDEKRLAVFCEKEHEAYVKLGMEGAKDVAEEANMVIKHYKELNAATKAERKNKKSKA